MQKKIVLSTKDTLCTFFTFRTFFTFCTFCTLYSVLCTMYRLIPPNNNLKGCLMVMADPLDLGHGKNA